MLLGVLVSLFFQKGHQVCVLCIQHKLSDWKSFVISSYPIAGTQYCCIYMFSVMCITSSFQLLWLYVHGTCSLSCAYELTHPKAFFCFFLLLFWSLFVIWKWCTSSKLIRACGRCYMSSMKNDRKSRNHYGLCRYFVSKETLCKSTFFEPTSKWGQILIKSVFLLKMRHIELK